MCIYMYILVDTECSLCQCSPSRRAFVMNLLDNSGREVLRVRRPCRCTKCFLCCCCPCCLQYVEVESPPGHVIAKIKESVSLLRDSFSIVDADGQPVWTVKGPCCVGSCCPDAVFRMYPAKGGKECGRIMKQWSGYEEEEKNDSDHYGLFFPKDVDIRMKAAMVAACILVVCCILHS